MINAHDFDVLPRKINIKLLLSMLITSKTSCIIPKNVNAITSILKSAQQKFELIVHGFHGQKSQGHLKKQSYTA